MPNARFNCNNFLASLVERVKDATDSADAVRGERCCRDVFGLASIGREPLSLSLFGKIEERGVHEGELDFEDVVDRSEVSMLISMAEFSSSSRPTKNERAALSIASE